MNIFKFVLKLLKFNVICVVFSIYKFWLFVVINFFLVGFSIGWFFGGILLNIFFVMKVFFVLVFIFYVINVFCISLLM